MFRFNCKENIQMVTVVFCRWVRNVQGRGERQFEQTEYKKASYTEHLHFGLRQGGDSGEMP